MKQHGGIGIGVVVAAYNAAATLACTLDSVLTAADVCADANGTAAEADETTADETTACKTVTTGTAADVCVIVADDGSTDGTAEVARRYAAADDRVRLLELTHGGQAAARAAAIAALPPQFDWVMIVDADDTIPQQALSQMAAHFSADTDMIIANVAKYTAADEPSLYMDAETVAEGKSYEGTSSGPVLRLTPAGALERMLDNDIPNFTHGMIVRRRLFDRIDWDTHPSITNAEDAMLQLLLASAAQGDVCVLHDIVAYEYRQRPGTLSSMAKVTPEGIARVWDAVSAVPAMPRAALVRWGLGLMHLYFIGRGVWIPQDYKPLRDIIRLARHTPLQSRAHRRVLWLLRCPWLRAAVTWRHR